MSFAKFASRSFQREAVRRSRERDSMAIPEVGLPVKLRKGMLQLSARQVQHITAVKPLSIGKDGIRDRVDLDGEGDYWIKTDYTKGEWWAWSLFRVA